MKKALRFTAEWCGPCKQFAPTCNTVAEEFPEIEYTVVNVGPDEGNALAQKYGVLGIPALVFLNDDEVVLTMAGNQPTPVVQAAFQTLKDK